MASAGGKRVLKVAKETQPYRTELTPSRSCGAARTSSPSAPRSCTASALHLSAVRGAGQPGGLGAARDGPATPRSGRRHPAQHPGHARPALRRARRRPRAGAGMLHARGSQILAPILRFRLYYLAGGFLGLIVILGLIRLALRPVVKAIHELAGKAEAVARGDYGDALAGGRS